MRTVDDPRNPRLALQADHVQIEALLERLLARVRAGDRAEALQTWRVLEQALLAHLDAEEGYLLPALESVAHAECERTRADHARIRRATGDLGMAMELHTAREEPVEAFCAFLKAHSEWEDSLLYPIAERTVPVVAARSLVSRLRAIGALRPRRVSKPARAAKASGQ